MKKTGLIIWGLFISLSLIYAAGVPSTVLKAFKARFPGASNVIWKNDSPTISTHKKETGYNAFFNLGENKMSAAFFKDGTWVQTKTEIGIEQLPQLAYEAVGRKYADGKIIWAANVDHYKKGTGYIAIVQVGESKHEVILYDSDTLRKQ